MIAHNVQIGDNTAMAGVRVFLAAPKSANCMIAGGGVGMVGHIEVCDNVFVTGMTMVTTQSPSPAPIRRAAMQPAAEWRKSAAGFVSWTTWRDACNSWKTCWPP